MERNRESRRGTPISGSFSSSRRRSRGSGVFREPSAELEDERSDSLRDRTNGKKERPSRRRRLNSSENFHVDRDDVADGSSDESMYGDHDEEDEPVRGGNSSRRTMNRAKTQYKGSDEIIGVSVPRRARSASAKRLQDSFSVGRQSSSSSPARTSAASVSPPSSNASTKAGKRTKPLPTKSRHPKISKVSISESEVEVAQFLYGLTRLQSHQSPAKPEIFQSSSPKRESSKHNSANECSVSVMSKASSAGSTPISTPPPSHAVPLPQKFTAVPAAPAMAPKRKKPRPVVEDNGKPAMAPCSSKPSVGSTAEKSTNSVAASAATSVEANNDMHATKSEVLPPKSDENTIPINSVSLKPETMPVSSPLQNSVPKELEEPSCPSPLDTESLVSQETKLNWTDVPDTVANGALDANSLVPAGQNQQIKHQDSGSSIQDVLDLSAQDTKPETPKIVSPDSAASKGRKGARFEIDLMAPPGNSCADDGMLDAGGNAPQISRDNTNPANHQTVGKREEIASLAEKMETEDVQEKLDGRIEDSEEKVQKKQVVEAAALERHPANEEKVESHHDVNNSDKGGSKQHQQKLPRSTARQAERTVPPVTMTPTSVPVTIPGWPSGLPPFGYMGSIPANLPGVPSLQGAIPVEGNSAMPNPPFVMLPQGRPNRCATHCYIARLIRYQRQLAKLNPFWHAASSAAFCGAKPYNLNILPQSDAVHYGGSVMRNPNLLPNNGLGSASAVALNAHSLKEKSSTAAADAQRKQPSVPQSLQQGAAFGFSVNQSRTGGMKPGSVEENLGLQTASGGGSAAASASMNANFGSIGATSDPQYLAMLQSNYSFPIPPAYRAHLNQQQQPGPPFFNGPFIPSQFLQLQPHSVPQTQNPTTSAGSSSSQKRLQAQHCLPATKPPSEPRQSDPESTGVGEDGADSRASLAQKKLQSQNFPTHPSFSPNFPQNFAMMAAALGGKQQQANDPSLQTNLKGMELKGTVPPGHPMFQNLTDIGHYHYQLADHQQVHAANPSKAVAKASNTNKTPDPSHSQPMVTAVQHAQKQAMARTKPVSAVPTPGPSAGMAYSDRVPVVYPNGTNFPAGSAGFPNTQSVQWRKPSSQRMPQANPSGNATAESLVTVTTGAIQASGSPVGKSAAKLPPSTVNSSRKLMPAGPSVLTQSSQAQSLSKAQQLFFSNSEPAQPNPSSTSLSQKWTAEPNSAVQAMFPGSLNMRRPTNQQNQPGSPGLSVASTSAYVVGGSKGPPVYSPLGGNPVAVMAAASYAQSASNMHVKSAEQKPTTA